MRASRATRLLAGVIVLVVLCIQGQAQRVLEHWDEGLRATASVPYNESTIQSDFESALPDHLKYLSEILIAERYRRLGFSERALEILAGKTFETEFAAQFWSSFVRANALERLNLPVDAALELRSLLSMAKASDIPELVAIAEHEWVLNMATELHGEPPAAVGARARVGLTSIAPEALRNWMLARSVSIMDVPDSLYVRVLAMQRYQEYFKANQLPALELAVLSNLAIIQQDRGEFEACEATLKRTREVAKAMNDMGEWWNVTGRYGVLAYLRKDYDRAADSLDKVFPYLQEYKINRLAASNRYYRAKAEYYRSESDTAGLALFHHSLDLAEEDRFVSLFEHDIEFLIYLYMSGDNPDAPDIVEELLERTWDFHRKYTPEGSAAALQELKLTDLEVESARADQERAERELAESKARNLMLGIGGVGVLLLLVTAMWRLQSVRQRDKILAAQALHREAELRAEQEVQEMIARHRFEKLVASIQGEEQERERIAQELHDNIGGTLGILAAQLQGESPISAQDGNRIGNQLNTVYNDLRALSHTLKLPDTQQNALVELTQALLANLERSGQVKTQLAVFPPNRTVDLPDQVEVQVFRVLQELSHNVIKHAKAKSVEVSMTRRADGFAVIFEDDGVGFDPNQPDKAGMGLISMRNRIESLSGTFHIDAQVGRGAIFSIDIPLT